MPQSSWTRIGIASLPARHHDRRREESDDALTEKAATTSVRVK